MLGNFTLLCKVPCVELVSVTIDPAWVLTDASFINVVEYWRSACYSDEGRGWVLGGALERADEGKMLEINLWEGEERVEKKERE